MILYLRAQHSILGVNPTVQKKGLKPPFQNHMNQRTEADNTGVDKNSNKTGRLDLGTYREGDSQNE